ncbi:MAG TPA: hypothetical protein ENO08_02835 [Candidatus Eisenbacteria bacterium]|uniref:Uncharacterized protein n=1 Tax=Eiseniibacteriota bacterium TaxID=2212470 RepID=A0A7V2AU97_UNCEI|nr:hypothetical protein [Candidatus Eisenbacteria bacterium]
MRDEPGRPPAGVGRTAFLFFLRFLAVSIPLYALYAAAGIHYMKLVATVSKPLFSLFDLELAMGRALAVTEDISLNPIVFISLVAATAGVAIPRRIWAGIIGFAVLTLANSTTLFLVFLSASRGSERLWAGTEFLNLTINFFLPLLLWIVLLPVVSLAAGLRRPQDNV